MAGKTHRDAVTDVMAHRDRLADTGNRKVAELAGTVQGHRGDSTVTVTAHGGGAAVTIEGPDAAVHKKETFDAARSVMDGPP